MVFAMKLLAPEALASAVIGKGGAVIASMRQSTQTKITLTDHSDLYPGTDCRVLSVQANSEESLLEVTTQIITRLAESAQANNPSTSEQLGQPGELKLRALAPRAAAGGLIGKGGAVIKQLRESTGAKISLKDVGGSSANSDQMVSAIGTQEALETIMVEVNRNVSALNKETWFTGWAAASSTSSGVNGATRSSGQGYSSLAAPAYGGVAGSVQAFGGAAPSPGVDMMLRVAQGLPPSVTQDSRGFALSCVVPNRLVGGLIGRGGSGTKEVQAMTNTKIELREIPGDSENRQMNIAGPLASTCAAYMLMMKRYLDTEAQSASDRPERLGGGGGGRRRSAAA